MERWIMPLCIGFDIGLTHIPVRSMVCPLERRKKAGHWANLKFFWANEPFGTVYGGGVETGEAEWWLKKNEEVFD